jgi:hypothetical protein
MSPATSHIILSTLCLYYAGICCVHCADAKSNGESNEITFADSSKTLRRETSIISIIAAPTRFHGKEVLVRGYVSIDNNYAVISYGAEPMEHTIGADLVFVDYSECKNKTEFLENAGQKWCSIIGVVDAEKGGMAGMEFHSCVLKLKQFIRAYNTKKMKDEDKK